MKRPKTLFVRPIEDRLVRDPVTAKALPAEGAPVPRTPYWLRRLQDGDIVEAEPPKANAEAKPSRSSGKKGDK